jgi:hypothetical protein
MLFWWFQSMVVTTRMFHQMNKSEPTIADIEKIDLELRKTSSEMPDKKMETLSN